MTAKEAEKKVKDVYPMATSRGFQNAGEPWKHWIEYAGPGAGQYPTFETEEAAWQNAAESLPAKPEQDENDEESLLPCPFCGGTARWGESPDSGHFIECSKCQSSTNLTYYLMDDASRDVRERWNRRVK